MAATSISAQNVCSLLLVKLGQGISSAPHNSNRHLIHSKTNFNS